MITNHLRPTREGRFDFVNAFGEPQHSVAAQFRRYMRGANMLKLIENNHYHIWTDALHARALSHETNNRWDRGTYVRWTLMTSWIALEIACQDALEDPMISYSFKRNLDKAIKDKSLSKLDWSKGIWQQVSTLQELRKKCVHRFSQESDLFPDASVADEAIITTRKAITEIYNHVGKDAPLWVNDNEDQGWAIKGITLFANAYSTPPGVDENASDTIKVTYIYKDKECIRDVLSANTDPNPYVDRLIESIGLPISGIKVYRGKEVIQKIQFPMDKIRGI